MFLQPDLETSVFIALGFLGWSMDWLNFVSCSIGLQNQNFGMRFRSFWVPKCIKTGTKWALNTPRTSKTLRKDVLDRFECRNASKYAPNELQTLLERLKRSEGHKYPFLCQKIIEICFNFLFCKPMPCSQDPSFKQSIVWSLCRSGHDLRKRCSWSRF